MNTSEVWKLRASKDVYIYALEAQDPVHKGIHMSSGLGCCAKINEYELWSFRVPNTKCIHLLL
jgi:hypothetical protein